MTEPEAPSVGAPAGAPPSVERSDASAGPDPRSSQRPVHAVAAGVVTAFVGAGAWAIVTLLMARQVAFFAIGVGVLVGMAVRAAGRGVETRYGVIGASCAFAGCLLGNVAIAVVFVSRRAGEGFWETLAGTDPAALAEIVASSFRPLDLAFYAIALWEGYRLAFRKESGSGA